MSMIHKGPARSGAKERNWRKHLSAQARGGLTARAYCRQQGLSEHSFYGWRRELAERDRQAKAAAVPAPVATSAPPAPPPFAELVLTGAAPVASSVLQIHLADARIEVFPGCDRPTLEIALAALRGVSC